MQSMTCIKRKKSLECSNREHKQEAKETTWRIATCLLGIFEENVPNVQSKKT
ncbi:hypothetical protein HanIR_Chr06g0292841 [Helianthus annuus]|nr:hypothetical protein HanIR_Chr06g0292841 [Helianthus annuus]